MASGLKPYPAYKPSGVEWLGEVPPHWGVRRLKYAVSFTGGGTPSKANASFWSGHVPWVSPKDMTRARLNDTTDHISNDAVAASAASIVAPGAVLMVVRSGILRRTIPVAINTVPMALNQDMKALRPKNGIAKGEYLHVLIQGNESSLLREWTKQGATVESIEHGLLANSRIPVPPLPEQAAIVRYLDRTDRRIRRCIQARERQIELLEEHRQALVHEAVTGRVDVRTEQPYPACKPSGVEWLGAVPAHWEVRRLKRLTKFVNGFAFKPADWKAAGVPIIRIENLNGSNKFNHTDRTDLPDELLIHPQDLLFAWSGNRGTSFGSFAWDREFPAFLNQHIFKLTDYDLDRRYFFYLLQSVTKHVEDNAHGIIGLVHITKPALGATCVPLAGRPEQAEIAEALDAATSNVGRVIEFVEAQIQLLNEYRTRLIADIVTGKLDVREAAAALPEADSLSAENADDVSSEDAAAYPSTSTRRLKRPEHGHREG